MIGDNITWTLIEESNPGSLPRERCHHLVTVDTESGRETHILMHMGRNKWLHDGEYTFEHSYYFRPIAWAERPMACTGFMDITRDSA